jgi:hypothetical protein
MQSMEIDSDESIKTVKPNVKSSPDKSGSGARKSAKPLKSSVMLQDVDDEMEPIDWRESPIPEIK